MLISSSQLYLITSCEEPAAAWTTLRDHFERNTLVNKLMLKKQYFRMEMKEDTSVEEHIKNMKELTDRLAAINAPIAEEDQIITLLESLPSNYSTIVTALEARDTISLNYVRQLLIREEQKLKRDSKLDGSMDVGEDEHSLESRSLGKVEDINTRRYATCAGSPDIFVGIVRKIIVKSFQSLSIKLSLFLWSLARDLTRTLNLMKKRFMEYRLSLATRGVG